MRIAAERAAVRSNFPRVYSSSSRRYHESSRLSASVNAFLSQPFSAVQHSSSYVYYEQRVCLVQLYLKYESIFVTGFLGLCVMEKIHN
jgi:hypothetical protein